MESFDFSDLKNRKVEILDRLRVLDCLEQEKALSPELRGRKLVLKVILRFSLGERILV